jgi:hypothetical protein
VHGSYKPSKSDENKRLIEKFSKKKNYFQTRIERFASIAVQRAAASPVRRATGMYHENTLHCPFDFNLKVANFN